MTTTTCQSPSPNPEPRAPSPLPRSERDFEIFFAVAFDSVSTRRAAERHDISQTRVRQVVTLVSDWVADNLPDFCEADLKKQVRLAQHIAANRLEHQYEQAMIHWSAESDPKYLRQATRVALAQARLGIVAGRVHALAADVSSGPAELGDDLRGAGLRPAADPVSSAPPTTASDSCFLSPHPSSPPPAPSTEDCSPLPCQPTSADLSDDDDPALTDSPETLIEREREQRLSQVEGLTIMERRLLTLIDNQGDSNPDKVAQLSHTLSRVRVSKATAELRLSRFSQGVNIEPLNTDSDTAETAAIALPLTTPHHLPLTTDNLPAP